MDLTPRSARRRAAALVLAAAVPFTLAAPTGAMAAASSPSPGRAVLLATGPTITSGAPVAVAVLGSFYSHTFTATGDPTPTWSATGSLPNGLTLNPTTGVLSGYVQPSLLTLNTFTVRATNSAGTATQGVLITTVLSLGGGTTATAPTITSAAPVSATIGTSYSHQFTATGTPAPTWSATTLPAGLSLNPTTGLLSGTPTGIGVNLFTVTATNSAGSSSQLVTLVNVNPGGTPVGGGTTGTAPAITSTPPVSVTVGTAFSHQFTATGSPAPTWSATTLPGGLSLNPTTGLLSGTPTGIGVNVFTVTATNSAGSAGQLVTLVNVNPGGTPGGGGTTGTAPAITSAPPVGAVVGAPYSHRFTASGTPAPTWSANQLPSGLTLNPTTGVLSGTPTGMGTTVFTVTATNPTGTATQLVTLASVNAASAPTITSRSAPPATAGAPYVFPATATGVPAPTWSVQGGLPAGLSIDATTGVITGTPTSAGNSTFTLVATNSAGSDQQTVPFVVAAAGAAPLVDSTQTVTGTQGVPLTLTLAGSGTPTWAVTSGTLPPGLSLDTRSGVVSGTPTTAATSVVTLTATNVGGSATSELTFVIAPAQVATTPAGGVDRWSGPDRVSTSVAVSGQLFKAAGSARAVVLTTSERYADALAGGRLASAVGGPLLLTPQATLSAGVSAELGRVLAPGGTVYVLGGTATLSADVANSVTALPGGFVVKRLSGDDRYATAVAVADEIGRVTRTPASAAPIYLVNGLNYPDGLAVSALAARTGGVVLLTADNRLPASTRSFLTTHDATGADTVPVGGRAVLAAGQTSGAAAQTSVANGISGTNRYDTARLVAAEFSGATGTNPVKAVGLATGENWPDALVGAAAMGALSSPLLLTPGAGLHSSTQSALAWLNGVSQVPVGLVFGGPNSVSTATMEQFTSLVPGAATTAGGIRVNGIPTS